MKYMSYSTITPCFACSEYSYNGGSCTDQVKLQEGINAMYGNAEHKGSGSIVLMCTKLIQRYQHCEADKVETAEDGVAQKIRNIFGEEMKLSAEEMIKVCDGTAELTVGEAKEVGELDAMMKVYKRINDEVLNK